MNAFLFVSICNIFLLSSDYLFFPSSAKYVVASISLLISSRLFHSYTANLKISNHTFAILLCIFCIIITEFFHRPNLLNISHLVFFIFVLLLANVNLKVASFLIVINSVSLLFLYLFAQDKEAVIRWVGNQNCLAQLLSAGLVILIFYSFEISNPIYRLLSFLLALAFMVGLGSIQSRGSFLFLLMALMTIIIFKNQYIQKKITFKLIGIVAVLSLIMVLFLKDYLLSLPHMAYRYEIGKAGFMIFIDHWVLGIGDNEVSRYLPQYWNPVTHLLSGAGETEFHVHNEYLQKAVEGGILKFSAFLILIAMVLRNVYCYYKEAAKEQRRELIPLVAIFIGLLAQISFDRILHFPSTGLFFYLIAGLLASLTIQHTRIMLSTSHFLLSIALIYLVCVLPFIKDQTSYMQSMGKNTQILDKIHSLQSLIHEGQKKEDAKLVVDQKYEELNDSHYKEHIQHLLEKDDILTQVEATAIITSLLDEEYHWSEKLKIISLKSDFPDLRVIAYKDHIALLRTEQIDKDYEEQLKAMRRAFPTINLSTVWHYDLLISQERNDEAGALIKEAIQRNKDPLLWSLSISHEVNFFQRVSVSEINECLNIRRKLEYDPFFAKKNIDLRFQRLDVYYMRFILVLLKMRHFSEANDLLKKFANEYKMKDKQILASFIETLRVMYPEFITQFEVELQK